MTGIQTEPRELALAPSSPETMDKLTLVHGLLRRISDVTIATEHILHAGMYIRTIRLEAGIVMMGALVKRPTVLIVNGPTRVLEGDDWIELDGYNVFTGYAGRKQLFATRGLVEMTLIFATSARTVEEAEADFTDEAGELMSRQDGSRDTVTITGV